MRPRAHKSFFITSTVAAIAVGGLLVLAPVADAEAAATTQENLAKYTRLRKRLTTEFMVVGDAQGQSQPAQERNETQGFIKWADNTINLGWYLSILASEYHMRANPTIFVGADNGDATAVTKTADELYYALLAMERVDSLAETAFPECGATASQLNGFFLRDDVPAGFHTNFPPLTSTQSDFIDPALTNKEESQDQVYHVLMGLALVKHLLPASVVVKGKTLKTWAADQAKRIGEHFAKDNWVIKNPACSNRAVARGEQGIGYSAGTKLVFGFISDGSYTPSTPLDVWGTLKNPSNPAYNDADNLHMAMAIAAVGNGWETTTASDLSTLAAKHDWPLYPILHRVLHGTAANEFCTKTGAALNLRARTMIDEMPAMGEPSNPRPGPPAVHGFTTNNRFIRSKDQHYAGQIGGEGMRYSGTDYLLLHNLYALATPATWTQGPNAAPCSSPPVVDGGGAGDGGGASSGSSGASSSSSSSSGSSGASGGASSGDGPANTDESASGCDCSFTGSPTTGGSALVGSIVALWLLRRRRSRSQPRAY